MVDEFVFECLTCCRQQRYKADVRGVRGVVIFIRTIAADSVLNVLKNSGERVGESPGRLRIVGLRWNFRRFDRHGRFL